MRYLLILISIRLCEIDGFQLEKEELESVDNDNHEIVHNLHDYLIHENDDNENIDYEKAIPYLNKYKYYFINRGKLNPFKSLKGYKSNKPSSYKKYLMPAGVSNQLPAGISNQLPVGVSDYSKLYIVIDPKVLKSDSNEIANIIDSLFVKPGSNKITKITSDRKKVRQYKGFVMQGNKRRMQASKEMFAPKDSRELDYKPKKLRSDYRAGARTAIPYARQRGDIYERE